MEEARPQHISKYDRTNDQVFKEYKRYKRKNPRPDFGEVIDFEQPCKYKNLIKKVSLKDIESYSSDEFCKIGLKHPEEWVVYELNTCPGFIVVVNPFLSTAAQSHWVKQALTNYTIKPYPCNLDTLMQLDNGKTIWEISREKSKANKFINQLRWVHMGYHFDYNVVDYKAKQYFGFPEDLSKLTTTIAKVFQFPDYVAETGIINYYPEGSSMGGHTDHYEEELRQPLISYSFGQSAVYLIGGDTRDIKPEAIWVRSGDIMLMTGPSRTAFHAVPCVLTKPVKTAPNDIGTCSLVLQDVSKSSLEEVVNSGIEKTEDIANVRSETCCKDTGNHFWKNEMSDVDSWKEFSDYITSTRININISQLIKEKRTHKRRLGINVFTSSHQKISTP